MSESIQLKTIFNYLMKRAKEENSSVNISMDTIWLHDCGFGFYENYFCVRTTPLDDDYKSIARWELPKLHFWEKLKMIIEFKNLVNDIDKRKKKHAKEDRKSVKFSKEESIRISICKKIGMLDAQSTHHTTAS